MVYYLSERGNIFFTFKIRQQHKLRMGMVRLEGRVYNVVIVSLFTMIVGLLFIARELTIERLELTQTNIEKVEVK